MIDRFPHLFPRHWINRITLKDFAGKLFLSFSAVWLVAEIGTSLFASLQSSLQEHWLAFLVLGLLVTVVLVRPRSEYRHKILNRDVEIVLKIGDAFDILEEIESQNASLVVPVNTTFETDLHGLIPRAPSIQGKLTRSYFGGNPNELDAAIQQQLAGSEYTRLKESGLGYNRRDRYPIGTVVGIRRHREPTFYLLASSRITAKGRAEGTQSDIDDALIHLWSHIRDKGDRGVTVMPLIGTGHGRPNTDRVRVAQRIIDTFIDSTREKAHTARLLIAIYPPDVNNCDINLDSLDRYLGCATKYAN